MSRVVRTERDDEARSVREHVAKRAEEDFADHVIERLSENAFLCRRPPKHKHAAFFWWRLIFAPCHVIILGDLGSAIFQCSDPDSLRWLLVSKNRNDAHYILGKLERPEYVFLVQEAKLRIAEMAEERPLKAARIEEAWVDEDDYDSFCRAWYEVTGDAEMPSVLDFSFQEQYRVQALLWFANHYQPAVATEEKKAEVQP